MCCTTFSEIAQIQLLALGENVISFRNCRLGNKFCKLDIIGPFIKKKRHLLYGTILADFMRFWKAGYDRRSSDLKRFAKKVYNL